VCRRSDRRRTLICHSCPASPVPLSPLATAVRFFAPLALLVAAVGAVPLSPPGRRSTRRAEIALAAITTHANSECCAALSVAAYPQPKNTIPVSARVCHSGSLPPIRYRREVVRSGPRVMTGQMTCAFGADDVAGPRPESPITAFSDARRH